MQKPAQRAERGVALVITLILLSVITFMAVTFLVVSRREAAQVDTVAQESNARFAADAALEQAKAQIVAQMLLTTNGLNFGLLVSTNYQTNSYNGSSNYTDVSYAGISSQAALQQMLGNLLILPRAPVFITNRLTHSNEFRFFVDLNRNGRYDTNGWVAQLDDNGNKIGTAPNIVSNFMTGDPEWIGVLSRPEFRHSSSNFFTSRYAFLALPIGNSLDINHIHNQSEEVSALVPGQDGGYERNQGVGSWELNLAGFLNGLNTNMWGQSADYQYAEGSGFINRGRAFDDAAAITQYRFNSAYNNIRSFRSLYNFNFRSNSIDLFLHGSPNDPIMTNLFPGTLYQNDTFLTTAPWVGADNPNPFFSSQDLFGAIPFPAGFPAQSFTNRFQQSGTNLSTYNQYTYYRMLSQMSFDSAAGNLANTNITPGYPQYPYNDKLNLNYNNVRFAATNFIHWTNALEFFTNAANRMLMASFPFPIYVTNVVGGITYISTNTLSLTNIPIYPANLYTPAVHRILQLAANIYDASTNRPFDNTLPFNPLNNTYYPSVFRPYFSTNVISGFTNVFIAGYGEVTNTTFGSLPLFMTSSPKDLRRTADWNNLMTDIASSSKNIATNENIYGVPYVIGAKTGLPAFNKFGMEPIIQIVRNMQLVWPGFAGAHFQTNSAYDLAVTNFFGVDCWYPYVSNFPRKVDIYVTVDPSIYLTNYMSPTNVSLTNVVYDFRPMSNFFASVSFNAGQLPIPLLFSNIVVLTNSYVRYNNPVPGYFTGFSTTTPTFENSPYAIPRWGLNITNRFRMAILDHATQRIIDYVQLGSLGELAGMDTNYNIINDLQILEAQNIPPNSTTVLPVWSTNVSTGGEILGLRNQIATAESAQTGGKLANIWKSVPLTSNSGDPGSVGSASTTFINWVLHARSLTTPASNQVPYAIVSTYYRTNLWWVNDPMVHYMASDLTFSGLASTNLPNIYYNTNALGSTIIGHRIPSGRYQPWGVTSSAMPDKNGNMAYLDPQITSPSTWLFPTNPFPSIGWLGRVHRGTPWQTVFLKSGGVDFLTWSSWTGNPLISPLIGYSNSPNNYMIINYGNYGNTYSDALKTQPTNDWALLDLFTTAPNENASRGQLSVNAGTVLTTNNALGQPVPTGYPENLAAWSAVLAGVNVLSNTASGITNLYINNTNISVNGANGYINFLVNGTNGINASRINTTNLGLPFLTDYTFNSLGQICAVPALTTASPYIDFSNPNDPNLRDEVVERIPQQILGLLRLGSPRYVVFAYGQSLKPAPNSIVQSGTYFGTCTNYQITGETVTRTVFRVENQPIPGFPLDANHPPRVVVESYDVMQPE